MSLKGIIAGIVSPSAADIAFERRGLPSAGTPAARRLEAVPAAVVTGFRAAMLDPRPGPLERELSPVRPDLLGFAYEGAVMATTIVDSMARTGKTATLMAGPAAPHAHLAWIGVGFALSRLPGPAWSRALEGMRHGPLHPSLRWLALDGYAFDLAFFHYWKHVVQDVPPPAKAWKGDRTAIARVCDQGLGRLLWFAHGGDPDTIAAAIAAREPERSDDLWSGIGLAAGVAGGADAAALERLGEISGPHRDQLRMGVVLGGGARTASGIVPEDTELACRVLAGRTPEEAADLVLRTTPPGDGDDAETYLSWRAAVVEHLDDVPVTR